jgi:hypothetical protein
MVKRDIRNGEVEVRDFQYFTGHDRDVPPYIKKQLYSAF